MNTAFVTERLDKIRQRQAAQPDPYKLRLSDSEVEELYRITRMLNARFTNLQVNHARGSKLDELIALDQAAEEKETVIDGQLEDDLLAATSGIRSGFIQQALSILRGETAPDYAPGGAVVPTVLAERLAEQGLPRWPGRGNLRTIRERLRELRRERAEVQARIDAELATEI